MVAVLAVLALALALALWPLAVWSAVHPHQAHELAPLLPLLPASRRQ